MAKIYTKIICNIFSGRFDVHLQLIQPILSHAYFSVTPSALNDVNVRGGNVIKPFAREIDTSQKFVSLWQIKKK